MRHANFLRFAAPRQAAASMMSRRNPRLAGFAALDNPTSSERTRALLGWEPAQPTLVEDLKAGHYFANLRGAPPLWA